MISKIFFEKKAIKLYGTMIALKRVYNKICNEISMNVEVHINSFFILAKY